MTEDEIALAAMNARAVLAPYVSPTAQPIEPDDLNLIQAELDRLGVKVLAGYPLPLEPDHAARLLAHIVKERKEQE